MLRLLPLLVPLTILAACEQRIEIEDTAPAPEQQAAEAPPAPGTPAAPDDEDPDPAFEGTEQPVSRDAPTESIVVLEDVRSAARNGYDRVVIEFRGGESPGHTVRYIEGPVTHCASGQQLQVRGNAFLEIAMSPAAGYVDEDGERRQTVQARDRQPGHGQVRHLKETCDHHGGVTWVVGLEERRPFRVLELQQPQRLVVDIRRP